MLIVVLTSFNIFIIGLVACCLFHVAPISLLPIINFIWGCFSSRCQDEFIMHDVFEISTFLIQTEHRHHKMVWLQNLIRMNPDIVHTTFMGVPPGQKSSIIHGIYRGSWTFILPLDCPKQGVTVFSANKGICNMRTGSGILINTYDHPTVIKNEGNEPCIYLMVQFARTIPYDILGYLHRLYTFRLHATTGLLMSN